MNKLMDYITIHLQLTLINLGSCNTLNDLSDKVCVTNKPEDLNLNVFNMIAGINESKILTKHVSCEWKCDFDGRKCNSNQKWNNNKYWCQGKNPKEHLVCKKYHFLNLAIYSCKNE